MGHEEVLAKVDSGRRGFLRKMAMGSAYALPLMTTVSLDSVITSARAQGVYGNPKVVRFRTEAVAAGPGNNAEPPQPGKANGILVGYWVITYDRPMDPKFNQAKAWAFSGPNGAACEGFPPVDKCEGDTGPEGFRWVKGNTEERHPIYCGTEPLFIHLKLNADECGRKTFYRDTMGNILEPFLGCADSFDILNGCPE